MLDPTDPENAHIEERLRNDPIIWLSSVRPDGRPHIVPVWFLWDGKSILIFSQPHSQKVRNLRHNPNVMLALDDTRSGEDVVLFEGKAELLNEPTVNTTTAAYAKKYDSLLRSMGSDAATMAADYSQPIRITPTRFISVE
jgi:PPOX class probable F420-dependent enzyme